MIPNNPWTRGGSGFHAQILTVKCKKNAWKLKWVKSNRHREKREEQKSAITMGSAGLQSVWKSKAVRRRRKRRRNVFIRLYPL